MDVSNTNSVLTDKQIDQIREIAESINYGTITLVFQDNKLVQIDHSEKIRIERTNSR